MPREAQLRTLIEYTTPEGKNPFQEWLKRLDRATSARIDSKVRTQLALGGGVTKTLGLDLFELKLDFGPGYRVYSPFFPSDQ